MAIERNAAYGGETTDMETPAEDTTEQPQGDTVDISLSMLGGKTVNPGDVVRLEVVNVDSESGTFTAKYATPKPAGGSINKAAMAFDSKGEM